MSNLLPKFDKNILDTVIWFQVFQSNTNNLYAFKRLQVTTPIQFVCTQLQGINYVLTKTFSHGLDVSFF